ncbi:sugar transferase [Planomonospora venezuelensis]|uniref:Exopolysaccharide biosynthesis polyprenyl glycosylphosphotransferase n=1 Tax=Planomonospora venezuelensis TaxID=1999 RepID=A0A841CWQ3_PLAVE|nr:sugar transferase [Planomonospora venezuelensis]MBB5961253.1 exopolysaccharide biosynthesis polyprenyl glycosylphosphotransferase [Planomonospora venezuelensis]GIM99928.1 exopolysaccharide biosynthesis polyprenyl glycosylphosphotransferase [Planomonospora venezuelensis]
MRVGTEEPAVVLLDGDVARSAPSIWTRSYARVLVAGDLACAVLACESVLGTRLWFGAYIPVTEALLGLGLALAWPLAMALGGAYRRRAHGEGTEEFRGVFEGGVGLTAAVAIGAYATQTSIARSFVMAMLPAALILTIFFRYRMRKRLHRRRAAGEYLRHVVAVGHRESVLDLVIQLRRQPYHGMTVVAACLPEGAERRDVDGVPVLGDFSGVLEAVTKAQADAVAVLACPELDGAALRRLAWDLENDRTDLFVAPALMDVAGPRVSIRPVAGMPLLHVEHPEFTGTKYWMKSLFDRCGAGLALLVLAVPMLVIAVLIRSTSPGPALFRQTRVGKDGREFEVVKFRTMVVDAERLKTQLQGENEFDDVLFKIRNDPRVTRVGAFLRRYSLDELPQLLNVVRGEMSLVGPRPPLPAEVEQYGADVRRRLVVKPGMTGLWQVSGRSDLSWEESVRLDLRYVENWSLFLDLQILWKTWSAVVSGEGAY